MSKTEEYEVYIEKLTNHAMGLAKIEGYVVFVPNSCPKDKLKIELTKTNKKYGYGKINEIIEESPYRVPPFCPMQKVCGACQIQFIDYKQQLEIKRQIVDETIKTIAGIDIEINEPIASPEIKNYRHKIQYPISETKNSKRILAGYYKPSTHEIVNIKYCPIQPEICDRIIDYIRETAPKYNIHGYNEQSHSGDLRHVVIRHSTLTNKCILTLVINSTNLNTNLEEFAKNIYEKFEDISGVCINYNNKKTNVILGSSTKVIAGREYIEEKILDKTFQIGAETFFQVNPKSAENIFKYVKEYINNNFDNPTILDAYAGISAFGICVSDVCKKVVSIEENLKSVELAIQTSKLNNVNNIEIHGGDATEYFKNETRKFDVIILDPPRKGCTAKSLNEAYRLCKGKIIYVSCNPATLARDLKILSDKGCKIESIQPFDMFCHTYHIENVAIISVQ